MIEDPPVLRIRASFPRPDTAQLDALRDVPTGFLVDALHGRGALSPLIRPLATDGALPLAFCGPALTCWCGPNDNLAVLAVLRYAQPGDVMVVATEAFESAAVVGDRVLGMARNRGVAAFVTDGMVRDYSGIVDVGLPVYCHGLTPNSPVRNGPGTVGLPVTLGGMPIAPGDLVAGDRDGVVVVARERLDEVCAALPRIRELEAALDAEVAAGLSEPAFVETLLDNDRIEYL